MKLPPGIPRSITPSKFPPRRAPQISDFGFRISVFRRPRRRAFTLVEILIVVVILGILAAIAVPKFSNASQISRQSSLKENLRFLRTQIGVYYAQHQDVNPGYPAGNTAQSPTADATINQLTGVTDSSGNIGSAPDATYKWGPYLSAMPANPVNNLTTITIIGDGQPLTADNSTGWLYQPSTGAIEPNVSGQDNEGKNYADY